MRSSTRTGPAVFETLRGFIKRIRHRAQLPQISAVYEAILGFLSRGYTVAVVYIDIVDFSKIEVIYGADIAGKVVRRLADALASLTRQLSGEDGSCAIGAPGGDDFVIFLAFPGNKINNGIFLDSKVHDIRDFLEGYVNEYNLSYSLDHPIELHIGYSLVETKDTFRVEIAACILL